MEGHWFKYKSNIVNRARVTVFRAHKVEKEMLSYSEVGATKAKPWVLSADYTGLDAFKTKEEALRLAERIVKGEFDIKMD